MESPAPLTTNHGRASRVLSTGARHINNGDVITWRGPERVIDFGTAAAGMTPRPSSAAMTSSSTASSQRSSPVSVVPAPGSAASHDKSISSLRSTQRAKKQQPTSFADGSFAGTPSSLVNREMVAYHPGQRRLRRASSLGTHVSEGLASDGLLVMPLERKQQSVVKPKPTTPRARSAALAPAASPTAPSPAHEQQALALSAAAAQAEREAAVAARAAANAAAEASAAAERATSAAKAAAVAAESREQGTQIVRRTDAPTPPRQGLTPRTPTQALPQDSCRRIW